MGVYKEDNGGKWESENVQQNWGREILPINGAFAFEERHAGYFVYLFFGLFYEKFDPFKYY